MVGEVESSTIVGLAIPPEWQSLPVERERSGVVTMKYELKSDDQVNFLVYQRAKNEALDVAADLKAVLAPPPHKLTQAEYRSIEVVLRHMSEDDFFERYLVETQLHGGQKVLVVEGMWTKSAVKNLAFFVDESGDCTSIIEFHYYAPAAKYDKYLATGKKAFQGIEFAEGVR